MTIEFLKQKSVSCEKTINRHTGSSAAIDLPPPLQPGQPGVQSGPAGSGMLPVGSSDTSSLMDWPAGSQVSGPRCVVKDSGIECQELLGTAIEIAVDGGSRPVGHRKKDPPFIHRDESLINDFKSKEGKRFVVSVFESDPILVQMALDDVRPCAILSGDSDLFVYLAVAFHVGRNKEVTIMREVCCNESTVEAKIVHVSFSDMFIEKCASISTPS